MILNHFISIRANNKSILLILLISLSCSLLFNFKKSNSAESDLSIANISALALKAKYTELNIQLVNNQFHRELYEISSESQHDLKGEIYAVVDFPFIKVSNALNNPEHWCDALILHINIKYCRASGSGPETILNVNLGQKDEQPMAQTYGVAFNYREVTKSMDYFAVEMKAANGPMGTYDYRIWIEATPIQGGRTFLHFTYTYSFGLAGRVAMQTYLALGGIKKVGFTSIGNLPNGQPSYIKGVRGVVERNTMRYFLAIDAYLTALTFLPEDQLEKRLQLWYNSTEIYAVQLHEVERNDYLEMKRNEYKRQQLVQ
jgi:hypothetical protein